MYEIENLLSGKTMLAVVGLGYVGVQLAVGFSNVGIKTIGFDIDARKIEKYRDGIDITHEVGEYALKNSNILFTNDEKELSNASVYLISVPTPITNELKPDLNMLKMACETVGNYLKIGDSVIFESTVFPGVTENICQPILEKKSRLVCGKDFKIGYSPERINPGDQEHKLSSVSKIVSACDKDALGFIENLYKLVVKAKVFTVSDIKTAEAIKITENVQRDVNIALMNEMTQLYHKLGIDTAEVCAGMNTKWNSLGFYPGLVGGHCIGVDSYYLIDIANSMNCNIDLVKQARIVNDNVCGYVVQKIKELLIDEDVEIDRSRIYVLGVAFKENCPDTRNSKAFELIKEFERLGSQVIAVDPYVNNNDIKKEHTIKICDINEIKNADCIIVTVGHDCFKQLEFDKLYKNNDKKNILIDVKSVFDKNMYKKTRYRYFSL